MRPGVHYEPSQTQCPIADKSSARILLAMAAAHSRPFEHMDISNANVQEPAIYQHAIYVREFRRAMAPSNTAI